MQSDALTALTRFGLGPRPGEYVAIERDARAFVLAQCDRPEVALLTDNLPGREEVRAAFLERDRPFKTINRKFRKLGDKTSAADRALRERLREARLKYIRDTFSREVTARFRHGVETNDPFVERLVLFWSNHFAVSQERNVLGRVTVGLFEREAIRPYVLGRFQDMLVASTIHPAMQNYLDNDSSVGPKSVAGKRRGVERANENLAREVLELHTLGAKGGYTQDDVIEMAHVLTGWNSGYRADPNAKAFIGRFHQPGPKRVMGVRYRQDGPDQLMAVLADLSVHPSTARHVATSMARHFAGDDASERLIGALERTFLDTNGDLYEVTRVLVTHDDAWSPPPMKMVPPYEFVVSAARAMEATQMKPRMINNALRILGQPIWTPPSPAGWPDDDQAFTGGDALLERLDFASVYVQRFGVRSDARLLARDLFGPGLDPFVAEAVARAEDRRQALTLLLMSPAFHRR